MFLKTEAAENVDRFLIDTKVMKKSLTNVITSGKMQLIKLQVAFFIASFGTIYYQ